MLSITDLPLLLCRMSEKGNLKTIKQIYSYINEENISKDEFGCRIAPLVETSLAWSPLKPSSVRSPLILAAINGHVDVCRYLITHQNANIETRYDFGNTALLYAVKKNQCNVAKLLVDNKANIKATNHHKMHAAYCAAQDGYLDCLKMLVEQDEDIVDLRGCHGRTLLIIASMNGMLDVCKYLVTKTKDVNEIDAYGRTALWWARKKNHTNIRDILLRNGGCYKRRCKVCGEVMWCLCGEAGL